MIRTIVFSAGLVLSALVVGCGVGAAPAATAPPAIKSQPTPAPQSTLTGAKTLQRPAMTIDPNKTYTATIKTSKGTMEAELFTKDAPVTVNNFVYLAKEGFYSGAPFHRIIKDFMVQTGDGQFGNGTGGPGYRFEDEKVTRDYLRGTLAMANAGPNTNGSQFFIIHKDYPLPKSYTIFGKLTGGDDILDAIALTPVTRGAGGESSTPAEKVTIESVTIQEK